MPSFYQEFQETENQMLRMGIMQSKHFLEWAPQHNFINYALIQEDLLDNSELVKRMMRKCNLIVISDAHSPREGYDVLSKFWDHYQQW